MIRSPIHMKWKVVLGVAAVVCMLAGYTLLSRAQHRTNPDDTTVPDWGQLAAGVRHAVEVNPRSGERWLAVDAAASGQRLFTGLAIGVVGALLLGMLMGCFDLFEAFFIPPLSLLAKIPPTAALAVFFVMVGTDTEMYVSMIAFGILPSLAQSIYLAVREAPREQIFKAYTLGASHFEVVWNIILPGVMPKLIDGVRLQIGPAMVYLIAAELVVSDVGFGYRIRLQSHLLNMNVIYPYLTLLAAFGYLMDGLLRLTQRVCCPWYQGKAG